MNGWTELQAAARGYWEARTGQERRFLGVGGAVVALALIYGIAIDPAVSGRAKLRTALPQLHQEAAQVQALAAQAAELARQPASQPVPMTRDGLTASLAARGLKPESVALTGEFARLQFKAASFPSLAAWLDERRRADGITAQEAHLGASAADGTVDATLTLRQAGGAQ